MATKGKKPSLAILIDAENTSARRAPAIFKETEKLGRANVRWIYGNFNGEQLKRWRKFIEQQNLEHRPQRGKRQRKNAADIALIIDAMDLVHRGGIDGFCLVSADGDLTQLAIRLCEAGKRVYCFGKDATSKTLRAACTDFINIERLPAQTGTKLKTKIDLHPSQKKRNH